MSTWQVVIKEKRFECPEGEKKRHLVNNGWECFIKSNNAISCINTQRYFGEGHYKFMLKIFKDGKMVWLQQNGKNDAKVLKTSKLAQWPVDGVIELPTGFDNQENPYSRKEAMRIFLSESCFHTL